jgi:glutaminase
MVKTKGASYAKSGVGGGILIVIPNVGGIGIISPKLDKFGNSVRGIQAGIKLSNILGRKIFKNKKTRKNKK